ncbi:MAG: rhomboid family intramembrane serine protease [Proteobacteria bacterium]|nr:rhomboid family intramembrane serine protease [Pseudomonadota bacterium]
MFVRLDQRRKTRLPWATIALVAVCIGVFFWLTLQPADARTLLLRRWGTVPSSLFDATTPLTAQWLALHPARLFTALFIHVGWLHLIGNLLFLLIFGLPAERSLGSLRFLLLFLVGGALANFAGALTLASANAPIVGSSGAVSAIVGAYFALFPRARLGLVLPLGVFLEFVRVPAAALIGFWIGLQFLFTFVGPAFGAVAWWTHIAGFVIGILFALVSKPAIARRLRQ